MNALVAGSGVQRPYANCFCRFYPNECNRDLSPADPVRGMIETSAMLRRVRHRVLWALILLFCANLSAQSNGRSTFHISGTVTRLGSPALDDWVTFEGALKTSVRADLAAHYEADLPLGAWTVAVTISSSSRIAKNSIVSHPRVFRVTAPTDVVLDLYVNAVGCGGVSIVTPDGRAPTPEEVEQKNELCQGRALFPVPSDDGAPFEVVVGQAPPFLCSFAHENRAACERQFGTYNLLTVYADKVVFTPYPGGGQLEASGNVVVYDGGRKYRRNSTRFLIGGGQAIEAY
jgi:hypothetical protein